MSINGESDAAGVPAPILAVEDVSVHFGGVRAVNNLSIQLGAAELVGLIGPNGAGKTTAVNAMSGFVSHTGRVRLGGVELAGMAPHTRAHAGLARTWQSLELFDDLTVLENCRVASERQSPTSLFRDLGRFRARAPGPAVERALDLLDLGPVAHRRPTELSLGQRKLVGVARALAADPSVLLLDEPAAGLDSEESARFGRLLVDLVGEAGVSVMLIDHDMGLVLTTCTRVYVLESGVLLASGTPAEVRRNPDVVTAYLGVASEQGGT